MDGVGILDKEAVKLVAAWFQEKGLTTFLIGTDTVAIWKNKKPIITFMIDRDLRLVVVSSHKEFLGISLVHDLNAPDSLPNLYDELVEAGLNSYEPGKEDNLYCRDGAEGIEIRLEGDVEADEEGYDTKYGLR